MIGPSFGNFNQNWTRSLIVILLIFLVIAVNKTRLKMVERKDIKWLLIWFLSGSWVTVLTFIAFNNLPIGTVYLVVYCTMIASGFISGRLFFGERMNMTKTIALLFAIIGLFVIFRFTISSSQVIFLFFAAIGGFLTGIWNTISKKFSDKYHNNQLVLMDAISSVAVALAGALLLREYLPVGSMGSSWTWIGIYAVVQTINVGLMVYGFKNVEAQIGSLILPVEIIFAAIFSYLAFGEIPTKYAVIGGIFIIAAAVLPSLSLLKRNHRSNRISI